VLSLLVELFGVGASENKTVKPESVGDSFSRSYPMENAGDSEPHTQAHDFACSVIAAAAYAAGMAPRCYTPRAPVPRSIRRPGARDATPPLAG
jgi:hypothetical protein